MRLTAQVLSRPVQQFSQSYNTPRYRTQHYHPYSRPSHAHHVQHAHHTRDCVQQTTPSFESWPTSIEYNDLSTAASASMNWNPTAYTASYPMYDTEHTSPYAAQPPSYMLPDPGHGVRSEVSYVGNFPRTHPHQLWLDSIDNVPIQHQHAQLISPIYPITPAESIKSQSLLTQPAMMNIDCERALPTPSLTTLQPILPSQGRETPPLSAASHRSSHTWTTDSVSNISAVSSRTSCGGSQDLPAMMHPYTACEDQPTTYPYQVDGSRPLLDNAVASLPITEDKESHPSKFQQVSQHPDSHNRELASLRARVSRDSLKSSSPSVYGQPIRSSTRRSHAMYPPRLMTSFHDGSCPSIWMPSPSTASPRHDSATSQAAVHPLSGSSDEYSDDQTHL